MDYEPGELDDVGSPISSNSDLGVHNSYISSQSSQNYTPPVHQSSPTHFCGSPISDDEFKTDSPEYSQSVGESGIPSSPRHTTTCGITKDLDNRSVGSSRSTGGVSGGTSTSHYSSPIAAAVKDRFRSNEIATRSLSAAQIFEQHPMTRANRKRSQEDPHVAKRLKR